MHRRNLFPLNAGDKLAKKKNERIAQRIFFNETYAEGLQFIINSLVQEEKEEADDIEDEQLLYSSEISANLKARAQHMALEPDCIPILESIYGGPPKGARRATLDDKTSRVPEAWKLLCDKWFNNLDWKPQNPQFDNRLNGINPVDPPVEPFSPEKLRALFSSMRTQFSVFTNNYHKSGFIEEGDGEGDDDFFDNFVRGDFVRMRNILSS